MTQDYMIVVKRHPDGHHYVPFDKDVPAHHRRAILGHLVDTGHSVEHDPASGHIRLVSGPLSHKGT